MNYSLLKYPRRLSNLGDYIQSLAARQFLPRVDQLISRERLGAYQGEATKLIMNGWYAHSAEYWPPSSAIKPLFTSFHLNSGRREALLTPDAIAYLRSWQPIGCRDHFTAETLQQCGVDAYFSGCLTLTLGSYRQEEAMRDEVLFVDVPLGLFKRPEALRAERSVRRAAASAKSPHEKLFFDCFDSGLIAKAKVITHKPTPLQNNPHSAFLCAEALLHRYARARAVVTTRIHCALPCLAMGTPVVFVNLSQKETKTCRFGGLLELLNYISISQDGSLQSNILSECPIGVGNFPANRDAHIHLAANLKNQARLFIDWL
jgi:hypothetical protein